MKKKQNGDGVEARVGGELLWLGTHADVLPGEVMLLEIRLKLSYDDGREHMAVVKAVVEGVQAVGFVSAPELDTLVHLVAAKLMNGTMKWREDRPYGS